MLRGDLSRWPFFLRMLAFNIIGVAGNIASITGLSAAPAREVGETSGTVAPTQLSGIGEVLGVVLPLAALFLVVNFCWRRLNDMGVPGAFFLLVPVGALGLAWTGGLIMASTVTLLLQLMLYLAPTDTFPWRRRRRLAKRQQAFLEDRQAVLSAHFGSVPNTFPDETPTPRRVF